MNTRLKIRLTFLGIIAIVVLASFICYPKILNTFFQKLGIEYQNPFKIHLGLDLQGGTHLIYQADLSKIDSSEQKVSMEGVRDVIERRVNAFGISEPVVQIAQKNRLIVELAGVKNINQAIKMIGETPYLEFEEEITWEEMKKEIEASGQPLPEKQPQGPYFKPTSLTGRHLKRADVSFDPNTHKPIVNLEFNDEGKKLFAEITERNVGELVAIYLDHLPISVPVVQEPIRDGKAIISGGTFEGPEGFKEAKTLAQRLNAGALPVPIKLISQQTVGASLGKISLEKSFFAAIVGLITLSLFMILYYRLPGLLAVISLGIYILIVISLFKLIPVTLTLAGIAGFILSIGMAVDANVLIFERMKEEMRADKPLTSAIEDGFARAWTSIRDSNLSTLIICLILFYFGTSIVEGFALTLGIGILVSMFSAIIITRTFLRIIAMTRISEHKRLFGSRIIE